MHLSVQQYATALHELLQEGNTDVVLKNFQGYLQQKGEMKKWLGILEGVIEQEEKIRNIERLTITTQFTLDEEQRRVLEGKVRALYPDTTPDLTYRQDNKVIGGFQIRGRDTVYDATVTQAIKHFSQALKS